MTASPADRPVFEAWYTPLQRAAERHAGAVVAGAALVFAASTAGLGQLTLDLSFRPLFASGDEIAAPTREFEQVFGQASGAWIVAILENDGVSTQEFLRETAKLSTLAGTVHHVAEIASLTSIDIPRWQQGALAFVKPVPDHLLDPAEGQELEQQFADLLDGTRFVNWLVSPDGSKLLLAARVTLPLADLDGRRGVVRQFEALLNEQAPSGIGLHFSGVSVVELAYERQVLKDQLIATALTSAVLAALLFWSFGSARAVVVCLLPVSCAVPATLGLMGWLGHPVTIINTVIPALILVIGVADAVHMLTAWLAARGEGEDRAVAARSMLAVTGKACFLTTVTTAAGFLALRSSGLDAVAAFGLVAAAGIVIAWLSNQVLLPLLLRRFDAGRSLSDSAVNRLADDVISKSMRMALDKSRHVLIGGAALTLLGCLLIPKLEIDQRFNEELPASHPVSRAQRILETDFGGFLGPEISVRRLDGGKITDDESLRRLDGFVKALRALPDTRQVWSLRDLLPRQVPTSDRSGMLAALRTHPATALRVRELVSEDESGLGLIVRVGDIGTRKAGEYRSKTEILAHDAWGPEYRIEIVGQWWLAQYGMQLLLRDVLTGIATAVVFVLPLLWLGIRDLRMFIAASIANLLSLLAPLAFMAAAGISLRIGTVVVLAIALGIVVDNTLHIVLRLKDSKPGLDPRVHVERAMRGTGRAVIVTTLALVGGFLSMLGNQLMAIRDMGLVAAVTFVAALLIDLLLLPALCAAMRATPLPLPLPNTARS